MQYKVKELAEISGVSVRTLHYYDEIGLLKPAFVSESGYRFYLDKNLERLQQILFFKEIGFNLEEVKKILDDPNFDRKKALRSHKTILLKKKERLEQMIETVDKTINSLEGGKNMKKKDMFKGFSMEEIEKHKEKYAEEAKERWGHTNAYKESAKRTSNYNKDDWEKIQNQSMVIYQKIIDNMDKGIDNPKVQEVVEEWRQNITNNFYNCTIEIFRGLGTMYSADSRFKEYYENIHPGLANFLSEAIVYYCDNQKE